MSLEDDKADAGTGGAEGATESETRDKFAAIENSVRIARKFSDGCIRTVGEGEFAVSEGPAWTMCIDELCNAIDALLELVKERR